MRSWGASYMFFFKQKTAYEMRSSDWSSDVCSSDLLTGRQGVLIPAANRKHLMLRHDVVEAVAEGRFQIYPIETIDEGIALLTGRPAGTREPGGSFPEGSIYRLVEERLVTFAEARRHFGDQRSDGGRKEDGNGSLWRRP